MSADVSVAVIGAVAVIIASIIGLIVAVTTAVIAKEQKVSEFRQAWINDLRSDLAISLQSAFDCIYELQGDSSDSSENVHKYNESFRELEFRITLIKLRLNPKKDSSFIKLTDDFLHMLFNVAKASDKKGAIRRCQASAKKIETISHEILKKEWEVVKKGENRFLNFKRLGKFCAGMLLIATYMLFTIAVLRSPILSF